MGIQQFSCITHSISHITLGVSDTHFIAHIILTCRWYRSYICYKPYNFECPFLHNYWTDISEINTGYRRGYVEVIY